MAKSKRPPSPGRVRAKGKLAWEVSWDNNMMSGVDQVFDLDGQFYYVSDNEDFSGPFDTLDEAVEECGLYNVNSTTQTVYAPTFSMAEVVAMLRPDQDDCNDLNFTVNGHYCSYNQDDGFVVSGPVEEEE